MKEKPQKSMSDICHEIAEILIKRYNFKTVSGKKIDEMYIYMNGIYEDYGKDVIRVEVEKRLGKLCKNHVVNEITEKIARKTLIERESMGCNNTNLICVENGVLDLKEMKLLPHNSSYKFMNKIPIFYNFEKDCPKFLDFLNNVLYEDDLNGIQEWFGFQFYRSYPIKKSMIFRGKKDTGKTQLMNILRHFIGIKNCSSKSLQELSQGKWQTAHLYNKYANIADEMSAQKLEDSNRIKALTGDSTIGAEKKFGDSFEFVNYAKLTFACNRMPEISIDDSDDAYFSRWIIIDFDVVHEYNNKNTKLELWKEITTDTDEMSGILNWALEGLKRLLKNKVFSNDKNWEEIKEIMLKEDPIIEFLKNCCKENFGTKIPKSELYTHFEDYCKLNGKNIHWTIFKFGIELKKHCEFLGEVNEYGVAYWKNLEFTGITVYGI